MLLKLFRNKPQNVLLGIISFGCLLSMWISNVPSSVLCPLCQSRPAIYCLLPEGEPFAEALLIGIAISNNNGGMTTLISRHKTLLPSLVWAGGHGHHVCRTDGVTVPFCNLLVHTAWVIIRTRYPPDLPLLQLSELVGGQPPVNRD